MELPTLTPSPDGFLLALRVIPKANNEAIVGVHNGALKVRLRAAPERGKANQAIIKLLEKALGPSVEVKLMRGETSQDKVVALRGFSDLQQCQEALAKLSN